MDCGTRALATAKRAALWWRENHNLRVFVIPQGSVFMVLEKEEPLNEWGFRLSKVIFGDMIGWINWPEANDAKIEEIR